MFSYRINNELELRLLTHQDAESVFLLIEQNRTYLRQWMSWVDSNTDIEHTRSFIHDGLQQLANNAGFHAGIWFQGALVGLVGMLPINWPNHRVEIGYWLAEDFQGKGIMTRACTALVSYIFTELKLHRIEIHALAGNTRSRAVAVRLGFHLDGTLRQAEWWQERFHDIAVYSLLRDEWNQSHGQ